VCLPRTPRCDACPLAKFCKAHALGREAAFPPPKPRAKIERVAQTAVVRRRARDGAILLRQRGDDEHNAGMWEVALVDRHEGEVIAVIRHAILANQYRIAVVAEEVRGGRAPRGFRWAPPGERERLALTTITKKILRKLEA